MKTTSVAIDNLTNTVALYNFLSTFNGTHSSSQEPWWPRWLDLLKVRK